MTKVFDPRSEMGRLYLLYLTRRSVAWASKYLDGRAQDHSGDETLRRFHFCNVWRELDRFSRWEVGQMRGAPLWRQLDVIVIGRLSLVPATAELVLSGAPYEELLAHRDRARAEGRRWHNKALELSTKRGVDFVQAYCEHRDSYVAARDWLHSAVASADDATDAARAVREKVRYFGAFRSYEVATSLTYSEHLPQLHEDQLFNVGPGAVDALEMLTGRRTSDRAAFEALRDEVKEALARVPRFRWLPTYMQGSPHHRYMHKFTLRTLEDSLCEFRKYAALAGFGTTARHRLYRQEAP